MVIEYSSVYAPYSPEQFFKSILLIGLFEKNLRNRLRLQWLLMFHNSNSVKFS